MNGLLLKLAIAAMLGSLFLCNPTPAQLLPPEKKAEHVRDHQRP